MRINPEEEMGHDPAFYAHDVACAIADMADRFPRKDLIQAIEAALASHNLEVVDLKEYRNAA